VPPVDDAAIVAALRAGDAAAFSALVVQLSPALLRVARSHVPSTAVAEEVVQETWLGVIKGIDRFEGRASLKTWVFRILLNVARTRGPKERRTTPLSELQADDDLGLPDALFADEGTWADWWAVHPTPWSDVPEERFAAAETRARIEAAIEELPPIQRQVVTLRDVEGWTAAEVCDLLDLTPGNQRVLLHRARSRLRASLETLLEPEPA
jgi:RNA polymerase sigma-70 factor, ECF subfamily